MTCFYIRIEEAQPITRLMATSSNQWLLGRQVAPLFSQCPCEIARIHAIFLCDCFMLLFPQVSISSTQFHYSGSSGLCKFPHFCYF